MIHDKCPEM